MSDNESSGSEKVEKKDTKKKDKEKDESEDEEDGDVHTSDMSSDESETEESEDDGKDKKPVLKKTGGPTKDKKKDEGSDDDDEKEGGKPEFLGFKLKSAGGGPKVDPANKGNNNNNATAEQPAWAVKRSGTVGSGPDNKGSASEANSQAPAWAVKLKKTENAAVNTNANPSGNNNPNPSNPNTGAAKPEGGAGSETGDIPEWRKKLLAQKRGDTPAANPADKKPSQWQIQQQQRERELQQQSAQQQQNRRPVSMGPGQLQPVNPQGNHNFGPKQGQVTNSAFQSGPQVAQASQQNSSLLLASAPAPPPVVEEKKEERFTQMDAKNAWKTKRELEVLKLKLDQERELRQKAQRHLKDSLDKVGYLLDVIKDMAEAMEEAQTQLNETGRDTQTKIEEIEQALKIEWRDAFFDIESKTEKDRKRDKEKFGQDSDQQLSNSELSSRSRSSKKPKDPSKSVVTTADSSTREGRKSKSSSKSTSSSSSKSSKKSSKSKSKDK